jgi:hypothetical protein
LVQGAVDRGLASVAALAHQPPVIDTVQVTSPLPAGVAEVVRWLFNTVPAWVQIAGVVVGALVGLFVVYWLFKHRVALWNWYTSRDSMMKATLIASAVALVTVAGVAGAASWNYTQHSNEFCTGCHVMNPAFQRFTSATNKHNELSCHDCHQQSIFASMRQVYLWVGERPEKIKAHSKVPNDVCMKCHVTGDTAKWKHVASTAGHRVHLESDSAPLKNLQCVKCHGVEVHRFQPVDKTCGQTDCHRQKDTDIILGKMATQTVRHCTGCHGFTADVPALATRDSARGTLTPGKPECLGCHEMRKVLEDFEEKKDPHGGKCGTCHNPHTQKTPEAAAASCAKGGCHDNWKDNPFHYGANHRKVAEKCITCHEPHKSKVDASGCQDCHTRVRAQGARRPPLPFDTAQALRRMNTPPASRPPEGAGATTPPPAHNWPARDDAADAPVNDAPTDEATADDAPATNDEGAVVAMPGPGIDMSSDPSEFEPASVTDAPAPTRNEAPPPTSRLRRVQVTRPAADSFPHSRHTKVACLVCHGTGNRHGILTFERPRGCAICHHQDPSPDKCVTCHREAKYGTPKQATVTISMPNRAPKPRSVEFLHSRHASRTCVECHTTPVTMAPAPTKAACKDCHENHHAASRNCTACHRIADPKAEHKPTDLTHQQCDACHTRAIVAELTPTRSLCSTCHSAKASNHYAGKECSTCHFLAAPDVYRARLIKPSGR